VTSTDLALGIACVLAGTAINSIGIILQKREVNKSGMRDDSNMAFFLKRPLWVMGILMQTLLFAPFFFIGIDLIGIALAQPLATAGLLVFVAGAVLVLKERVSRIEWIGITLMIAAIFLVSAAGVAGDVTISIFFQESFLPSAVLFLIVTGAIAASGGLLVKLVKKRVVQGLAMLVGTSYAVVSISGQLVTIGFDAALLPGNELLGWVLGITGLVGVVVGTVFGIVFSQRAFQKGEAIRIIPISQPINNVLPIVAGVYLFGQYIGILWLFIPGVVVLLVAVTLLARFQR
jgi:drug/metabolite transporter (DMT)-like permease